MIQVKRHDPTGTIILDRPDKRNALSRDLIAAIGEALEDLHGQRAVRTIVLTGAGSAFCAGMDLGEMLSTSQDEHAMLRWHEDAVIYRDLLQQMLEFPKPLIAAVNGPVMAGGAGLMLACDVVLAAPSAQFGLPEPRRGLVAGIVSPLLAFRAGGGWAANLLVTGRTIEAEEALRIGLYHEVVEENLLWARAHQLSSEIARGAPEALQLTRRMLYETIGEHLATLLSAGAAMSATARTTEAAAEGIAAFLAKREPVWK
jgi:methylglutaconyl-CoA hydratase